MLEGLKGALTTLTIMPVGQKGGDLSRALPWFPIVGAAIGAAIVGAAALLYPLALPPWGQGAALLLVLLNLLFTRGLHLDGLSDWADSTGGLFDRERRLKIMKDVHLGAFGVMALILDLLARFLCYEALLERGMFLLIVPVNVLSRGMLVELIATLPYAGRSPGMAAPFVAGASRRRRVLSLLATVAVAIPFAHAGVGMLLSGLLISRMLRVYFLRRYGGVTGDLLGASNEIIEISMMFLLAFFSGFIGSYCKWSGV